MTVFADLSTSLDGYVAGPNDSREHPLGDGGERLHEWVYGLQSWRAMQGLDGGEAGSPDDDVVAETVDRAGAFVMGRRMFDNGEGPWGDDPFEGYWGDEPPYRAPVFVVTHHRRDPLPMAGGTTFTFVTDGLERAVALAEEAAGDDDVQVSGGATAVRQAIAAGLVDELQLHVVPVLLGAGNRLFEPFDGGPIELERTRVVESPTVTHLRYRVRHDEGTTAERA